MHEAGECTSFWLCQETNPAAEDRGHSLHPIRQQETLQSGLNRGHGQGKDGASMAAACLFQQELGTGQFCQTKWA